MAAPALNAASSNKFATNKEVSGNQNKSASKPVRIRRPLLLAQAHLSKAGTSRVKEDASLTSSNVKSKAPPLLPRISTTIGADDTHRLHSSGIAIEHSAPSFTGGVDRSDCGVPEINVGVLSVRDKLRQRLLQEKADSKRVMSNALVPQSQSHDGVARVDPVAAETKLRAQARLRTKLANERRQGIDATLASDVDQNSGTERDVVGRSNENPSFVGMDAGLQETGREESLKALLERRRKPQPGPIV